MRNYSIDTDARKKAIIIILIISYILLGPINKLMSSINSFLVSRCVLFQEIKNSLDNLGLDISCISILVLFAFCYWIYAKWLWKRPCFVKLHGVPNLNGSWVGAIESSYKKGEKYKMSAEIKQNWNKIQICCYFDESSSASQSSSICINDDKGAVLRFSYQNTSQNMSLAVREYTGFNELKYKDNTLSGFYFTNRGKGTHGSIFMTRVEDIPSKALCILRKKKKTT